MGSEPSSQQAIEIPRIAWKIIENLKAGLTPSQVYSIRGHEVELDEIIELVRDLSELGFVQSLDGNEMETIVSRAPLPLWLVKSCYLLTSTPAFTLYFMTICISIFLIAQNGISSPSWRDLIVNDDLFGLNILVGTVIVLAILGLHELAHFATAVRFGLIPRFTLGTRLFDLVVQTDVSGVWILSKWKAAAVLLSGIFVESVLILIALATQPYLGALNFPSFVSKFIVVYCPISIVWQFRLYMRTDIYFLFVSVFDLSDAQRTVVRRIQVAVFGRQNSLGEEYGFLENLYALTLVIGTLFTLTAAVFVGFPAMISIFSVGVKNFSSGDVVLILDSLIGLVVEGGLIFLFLRTFVRDKYNPAVLRLRKFGFLGFLREPFGE